MEANEFQLDRDTEELIRELVSYLDDWRAASKAAHGDPIDETKMPPDEADKAWREREERLLKFRETPVLKLWNQSDPTLTSGRLLDLVFRLKTLSAQERTAAALERIASHLESKEK